MKQIIKEEELKIIVKDSLSIADVCRQLNIQPKGGNYKTLQRKFKKWNINISHFTGKAWNVGNRFKYFGHKFLLKDILVENSTYSSTSRLKIRLINEGFKKEECDNCLNTTWMGQKIPLELEHKNGINTDHRLTNLSFLCPNCHALTSTYRGKNIKYVHVAQ